MPVGVIGLGNMGHGMMLSLQRAGHDVLGYDAADVTRATRKADGLPVSDDLGSVVRGCDTLILSLPHAGAVRAVVEGAGGILATAKPSTLVIDTSTSEPAVTRELAQRLSAAGHAMLDAPVSGGPKGAHAGTLTMVIGGSQHDLARALPVLEAISARRVHVGPSGAGHVTKLINNLLCGANLVLLGEAMEIIRRAGLDIATVFAGINAGSGRSGVSEVNLPNWISNGRFDSGFSMGLMRKDVRLAGELIDQLGLEAEASRTIARQWVQSAATLGDDADFNRMVERAGGERTT